MTLDRADAHPRLVVRLPDEGWLGGVCAGIGRYLGIPSFVLRSAFVVAAAWRLSGVIAYLLVWLIVPLISDAPSTPALDAYTRSGMRTDATASIRRSPAEWGRLIVMALVGAGLIGVSQRMGFGLPTSWLAVASVAAVGLALVWRQADRAQPRDFKGAGGPLAWLGRSLARGGVAAKVGVGAAAVAVAVVAAATLLPLGDGAVLLRTLAALGLAVAGLVALALPWALRARRALAQARESKLVSDARADMAAHLHDSVLQTLALIQRQAGDQRAVTRLARRQERELRAWLYGTEVQQATLGATLASNVQEVEDEFDVDIELVTVGDVAMTPRIGELAKAAREAMVNAAKHSGAATVDVYAEVDKASIGVFVRDRGRGFDPNTVGDDRLGVSKSIMERMERHGGRARVRSAPGEGTEVALEMST